MSLPAFARRALLAATAAVLVGGFAIGLAAPASAHFVVGVGIGLPVYAPGPYYYYGPPVYYAPAAPVVAGPVVAAPSGPAVVPATPSCNQGQWKQADGSVVTGTACLQPDGTWRMTP